MNTLFPIFLKLEHLHTLIVGGGNVGLEKLEAVLKNSPKAKITLVAPEIREEIRHLAQSHDLTLVFEKYDSQYLNGIDLVIAGTDDKSVNQQVQIDCKTRKVLVNIADTPDLCDFYLSSVVQKDDLKIAISTNGKSPTFAKRFREILEEILPGNLQETLDNLQAIRNKLKGDFQDKVQKLNEITKVMRNQ
ncbi:bifunctional precorrin-2 dehydrogenase/sirohydrochlorin ferrochelatase [Emticicia sp. TH156]|uniref:precorrin-2 dehydrogenase/sirohydrochlorin ferrochelatase family protein n=1 Tax=Emticicia sp. TH156 TaxID=2067454 RepID=UPI000C77AA38|nr:bifunctional precorrin-2 dehydrogenase/sirohydrochlorin ferrochelatase [Emticicia sp. TH156]PLK42754.1 siroheme synthase [Emticicia sp. TH156]